ncbi:hypothetical protein GCM10027341_29560 [Spirosoma knui]
MKLRIGKLILNRSALLKLAFACFLVGIHIGVTIAAHEDGKQSSFLPFMALYIVVIPAILWSVKKDVNAEKADS